MEEGSPKIEGFSVMVDNIGHRFVAIMPLIHGQSILTKIEKQMNNKMKV